MNNLWPRSEYGVEILRQILGRFLDGLAFLRTREQSNGAVQKDLALCRAGASTLAEVATIGLPVIFVPYPHASDEHQRANADYFASRGAAAIVQDAELSPDSLYWQLVDASEPAKLDGMRRALLRLRQPDALNVMIERLQNSRIGDDKNIAA